MKAKDLVTVRQLAAEIPGFTEGGLRYRIFHAEKLGLSGAILRVGRKVLIDREAFLRWLQDVGKPKTNAAHGEKGTEVGQAIGTSGGDL
ncbi:MAG TPA: hypothetical protein P5568_06095 [Acidobacteriota bacterium]|jgi:hypothetical protein|nr:hypothetical protein [Acidobacteriota bacterium]